MSSRIEEARRQYLPPHGIQVLLIAEAPPAARNRFFYCERVSRDDWLFLAVMRVLYKDARSLSAKHLRTKKKPRT